MLSPWPVTLAPAAGRCGSGTAVQRLPATAYTTPWPLLTLVTPDALIAAPAGGAGCDPGRADAHPASVAATTTAAAARTLSDMASSNSAGSPHRRPRRTRNG